MPYLCVDLSNRFGAGCVLNEYCNHISNPKENNPSLKKNSQTLKNIPKICTKMSHEYYS